MPRLELAAKIVFGVLALLPIACGALMVLGGRDLKVDFVRADLPAIAHALSIYRRQHSTYPDELAALVSAQVMEKVPTDPWQHDYLYVRWGGLLYLASFGKDGVPGGEDNDADIGCWITDTLTVPQWLPACAR